MISSAHSRVISPHPRLEHHALNQEKWADSVEAQGDGLFSAFAEALESRLAMRSASEQVARTFIEHDGRFALLQGMLADVLAVALANCAKPFF